MIYRYFTRRDLSVFPAELDNDDLTVIWDWVNATVKGEVISAWPRQDDEERVEAVTMCVNYVIVTSYRIPPAAAVYCIVKQVVMQNR